MADFVAHYSLPSILVVQNYLGSINHTLLSIEVLKSRGIDLLGIVICGAAYKSSESFIEQYAGVQVIARIPHIDKLDKTSVQQCANDIRENLQRALNIPTE